MRALLNAPTAEQSARADSRNPVNMLRRTLSAAIVAAVVGAGAGGPGVHACGQGPKRATVGAEATWYPYVVRLRAPDLMSVAKSARKAAAVAVTEKAE